MPAKVIRIRMVSANYKFKEARDRYEIQYVVKQYVDIDVRDILCAYNATYCWESISPTSIRFQHPSSVTLCMNLRLE